MSSAKKIFEEQKNKSKIAKEKIRKEKGLKQSTFKSAHEIAKEAAEEYKRKKEAYRLAKENYKKIEKASELKKATEKEAKVAEHEEHILYVKEEAMKRQKRYQDIKDELDKNEEIEKVSQIKPKGIDGDTKHKKKQKDASESDISSDSESSSSSNDVSSNNDSDSDSDSDSDDMSSDNNNSSSDSDDISSDSDDISSDSNSDNISSDSDDISSDSNSDNISSDSDTYSDEDRPTKKKKKKTNKTKGKATRNLHKNKVKVVSERPPRSRKPKDKTDALVDLGIRMHANVLDFGRLKQLLDKDYKDSKYIVTECDQVHPDGVCLLAGKCPKGDMNCYLNPDRYSCITHSKLALSPHQSRTVIHMMHNDSLLAFHATGTGKTLLGIVAIHCALANDPNMKAYIVTPTSTLDNFKKALNIYGVSKEDRERYIFVTHTKFCSMFKDPQKRKLLEGNFLLIDESHNFRSSISKQVKIIVHTATFAKKVLLLSATPAYNEPADLCIALAILHRTTTVIPPKVFNEIIALAIKNDPEALSVMHILFRCRISIHRDLPEGLFPQLKPKLQVLVMSPSYYNEYTKLEKMIIEELEASFAKGDLGAFYNGLRRAANADSLGNTKAESPKTKWILDFILKHPNEKCMVYSNFIEMGTKQLDKVLKEHKVPHAYILGSTPQKLRGFIVQKYNNRELQVLLGSQAASEGLDLVETENTIQYEPGWNISQSKQVQGRGARRNSHINLPAERRVVNAISLILDKPNEVRDVNAYNDDYDYEADLLKETETYEMERPSIDHYIYRIGKMKERDINKFIKLLIPMTIEKKTCSSKIIVSSEKKEK